MTAVASDTGFTISPKMGYVEPNPMNNSIRSTEWMNEGNCRNFPPAVFFPADGAGVDRARLICTTCPVTSQCLEYALAEHIDHGVWGGCSERERRRIAKRRRIEVKAVSH